MELSLILIDPEFIDACVPRMHQPFRVEFPIFIAVRTKPVTRVNAILVCKPDGNPIVQKRPSFFDEPVVQFSGPFPRKQRDDLLTSIRELGPISPT